MSLGYTLKQHYSMLTQGNNRYIVEVAPSK